MTALETGPRASLSPVVRGLAALLCLGVVAIHVIDQGGIPGDKTPTYVGVGYYLLEAAGVLAAVLLVRRSTPQRGWLLAGGVALGPFLGYVLSRGPGLPGYRDDVGNWGEPLGVVSLIVEGLLFALAVVCVVGARRRPAALADEPERRSAELSGRGASAR